MEDEVEREVRDQRSEIRRQKAAARRSDGEGTKE